MLYLVLGTWGITPSIFTQHSIWLNALHIHYIPWDGGGYTNYFPEVINIISLRDVQVQCSVVVELRKAPSLLWGSFRRRPAVFLTLHFSPFFLKRAQSFAGWFNIFCTGFTRFSSFYLDKVHSVSLILTRLRRILLLRLVINIC